MKINMDIDFPLQSLPAFILYALIVCLLLKPGRSIPQLSAAALLGLLLLTCYVSDLLNWQALTFITLLICGVRQVLSDKPVLRYLGWAALSTGPLLLALHRVPGFTSHRIFGPEVLGMSTLPYTFNINIDKALGALLIIFYFRYWLNQPFKHVPINKLFVQAMAAIIGLFAIGYWLGVELDPKIGELTLAFVFFNLFVTCVAEESFFRLIIHRFIYLKTSNALAAIVGSSFIFTLAHFHTSPGAIERLSLTFIAGLIYAWIYQRSDSLLAAILCHFIVNFIHFSFFVYPASFS